jgi:hypothetical protein
VLTTNLPQLFESVSQTMQQNCEALNQADTWNGNHGDHMVEIFRIAAQAARQGLAGDLAGAMRYAGQELYQCADNDSAQVYARGLSQFAHQFEKFGVNLEMLVAYVQNVLKERNPLQDGEDKAQSKNEEPGSAQVLKALLAGLAGWQQSESDDPDAAAAKISLEMGFIFELGMAYMQAKQRGGSKSEILADAAVSASPLSRLPYRYQSGKLAVHAFLQAMQAATGDMQGYSSS